MDQEVQSLPSSQQDQFLESIEGWEKQQNEIEAAYQEQCGKSIEKFFEQFRAYTTELSYSEVCAGLLKRRHKLDKLYENHVLQKKQLENSEAIAELKLLHTQSMDILCEAAAALKFKPQEIQENEVKFEEAVTQKLKSKLIYNCVAHAERNQQIQKAEYSIIWISNSKTAKFINFRSRKKDKFTLPQKLPTLFGFINLPTSCILAGGVVRVRPRALMKKYTKEIELNKPFRNLAPLLKPRMKFAFAYHEESQSVYALGGNERIRLLFTLKIVHVYRRIMNKWEIMRELPDAQPNGSSCVAHNSLFYFYTTGRRISMHQIIMRLHLNSARPHWQILAVLVTNPRLPSKLEAYRLPVENEIWVEDTRKKTSRVLILNKKGQIAHHQEKEVVEEEVRLRKLFYKRKGRSLFRICKSMLYELDWTKMVYFPVKVENYNS